MIKTGNELSELILTFTTDTVTVLQKRVDKNEQGIATKKIDTEYTTMNMILQLRLKYGS